MPSEASLITVATLELSCVMVATSTGLAMGRWALTRRLLTCESSWASRSLSSPAACMAAAAVARRYSVSTTVLLSSPPSHGGAWPSPLAGSWPCRHRPRQDDAGTGREYMAIQYSSTCPKSLWTHQSGYMLPRPGAGGRGHHGGARGRPGHRGAATSPHVRGRFKRAYIGHSRAALVTVLS